MDNELMLKALGEPVRLTILQLLLQRKHCVRSLSKKLSITEPAVSQHLKVLRESGLIYGERFGRHIHYLPNQEALDHLTSFFETLRRQSLLLDRTTKACNCEFRKERTQE